MERSMERDLEKDLIEIECAIKSQKEKDNVFTMSVLQRCYQLVSQLKEYKNLEEQNRLIKLPCAVGDTVYRVHKGTKLSPDRTYECRVVGVKQEYNTFSVKLYANINEETYSIWIDDWFDRCQIGYEFFLTREEAEAALKELERGK